MTGTGHTGVVGADEDLDVMLELLFEFVGEIFGGGGRNVFKFLAD